MTELTDLAARIRLSVIDQSKRADVGHIGSALSVADVLAAVYGSALQGHDDDPERDRLILSKGHAALALYATLHETGRISAQDLQSYCVDGSAFGGHPEHSAPGIDFSTGSLGHGLSIGAGVALAALRQASPRRAFVIMSDAELNEGSVWEAAMFAAHHGLSNLIAIVDDNGQQALGPTAEVMDLQPLHRRWEAFGWDARDVPGNDPDALAAELESLDAANGRPHVLIAKTTFGKGVSFMEGEVKWHYWPMSEDDYRRARGEVAGPA